VLEPGRDHCKLLLKNSSGIPVIEVIGVLNNASVKALESMIAALEAAGHYNIVLNIRKALAANFEHLSSLSKCVGRIRGHYGNIELVADAAQIKQMATNGLARLFRLCTSESQAFGRIKRLPRPPDETVTATSARIMDREWPSERRN
jgi:cell division inhibitor SulA